jgi:predicted DCC family thiol-disulfide oxidoreductase YuxK
MSQSIIIFDGVCNLCNASINFIIKHDHAARFSFATTQSEYGQQALNDLNVDPKDPSTFIFIEGHQTYFKSDAALRIASHFKRPWSTIAWLKFIPKFIRNFVYSMIAKHRYKILGKRQSCMIPSIELKKRFID